MPPRKSNVSAVSTEEGATGTPAKESGVGVEEYNLPRTMIQRLSKGVLPPNTQIQKDALLAISKSATVFVNYLTAHANESAQRANKKTIQPKDVMDAIAEIEFDHFLPRLDGELTKYNAVQCDKRNTYRRKIRDEQKAKNGGTAINPSDPSNPTADPAGAVPGAAAAATNNEANHDHDDSTISMNSTNEHVNGTSKANGEEPPASKKLKRENGDISDADEASGDEGMDVEEDVPDEEGSEDDEEEEDEGAEEGFESAREEFGEDALEERVRGVEVEDDVMDDGDDSD